LQEEKMAAAAGLLNGTVSGQPLAGIQISPMASSGTATNNADSTNASSADISADDFLTLLVTEMKNQDPTANTDPNEYINQLVNVNSLEQLISINQTLSGALGSSNSNGYAQTAAQSAPVNSPGNNTISVSGAAHETAPVSEVNSVSARDSTIQAIVGRLTNGNLSVPEVQPAADRLAHALDGRSSVPLSK
jgi:flagellar basal-body rod modification protein FlgD